METMNGHAELSICNDVQLGPRALLRNLAEQSALGFAGMSRLIGRNPAYIQQFVTRGTPKKLDERDRAILAKHFNIEEAMLCAPPDRLPHRRDLSAIPMLSLGKEDIAGNSLPAEAFAALPSFGMDWFCRFPDRDAADLCFVRAVGDAMTPTICDQDMVILDRKDTTVRDGVYAVAVKGTCVLKRIIIEPHSGKLRVSSDNPLFPQWRELDRCSITIVGRAIWFGRALP